LNAESFSTAAALWAGARRPATHAAASSPITGEFEVVIMIEGGTEETHGSD